MIELSETQQKVMRYVCRHAVNRGGSVQIAGNGRGPWLSACRALARKGLMHTWTSGRYALTAEGQPVADKLLADWRAAKAAEIAATQPEDSTP